LIDFILLFFYTFSVQTLRKYKNVQETNQRKK
jgi:hypothetical protein